MKVWERKVIKIISSLWEKCRVISIDGCEFAEFAIKSRDRKMFHILKLASPSQRQDALLDLYDDLSQRKIIDDAKPAKVSQLKGTTLLSVINESFTTDPRLMLALQYEKIVSLRRHSRGNVIFH